MSDDPSLGRFISEDPAGLRSGANLYAYVANRPTMCTDPIGLWGIAIGRYNFGSGDPWLIFDEQAAVAAAKGGQGVVNAFSFGLLQNWLDDSWHDSGYSGVKCDENFAFGNEIGGVSRDLLLADLWPAGLNGGSLLRSSGLDTFLKPRRLLNRLA
jgi:hypothetical protein